MSDIPFAHNRSAVTVVAGARPCGHGGPDDGSLRITREARPLRLLQAGDIDLDRTCADA